jgi:tRNA threonylcarbamoyl adenosine modification protein YeaZ
MATVYRSDAILPGDMRILFLDLGNTAGAVACVTGTETVVLTPVDHRVDDASLGSLLEDTVRGAGWTMKDLTHLACVTGPGGFTSLRVAAATANALAFALGIKACGIHLSDLIAARASDPSFLWLHSTKKHQLFVRGFGDCRDCSPEAQCIELDTLPPLLSGVSRWAGDLLPEHRSVVDTAGCVSAPLRDLQSVLPGFLSTQPYGEETIVPWYGRGW